MTFGPLSTIFTSVGLLAIAAGVYVIITLRYVDLGKMEQHETVEVETHA